MPIYEYSCKKCNDLFSLFLSINAGGKDIKCPKCGSSDVQKKISSFSCCSVGGGSTTSFGPSGGHGGG
jgi:putative FmdB family regulatory protein